MKKLLLTIREYQNNQGEAKKYKIQVGKIHQYKEGGEAIILDAALCATLAAMGQKALNAGEDSVWLSMWEDLPQGQQQAPQQQYQQAPQIPQQQQAPAPDPRFPAQQQGQPDF